MRKKFQLTSLRAAGAALFGWRRQTPALLGRQSASRRCRAPGPTPREPGCKCRWEPQHAPPLRAAFPHFTSPSPAAGPRPSEKRSQALTRPPAAIPPGLPPSLRECPARRRPPPGSERQPRTYRRSRAAVRARRAALEPSSAELRPERPRRAALAAQSGISSPPPARPGAERAGAVALPAPRLPPCLRIPSLLPAEHGRPAAAPASAPVPAGSHRGRPAPPARRSRCPLRSAPLRCASVAAPQGRLQRGRHRPPPPTAAPSSPPSLSLCLSLLLSPSLPLPPAPGAAGKMPTHARLRPLPPLPGRARPRPLPALRVRPELHGGLGTDSGVGSLGGELQPCSWPQRRFLWVLFGFVFFLNFFLGDDLLAAPRPWLFRWKSWSANLNKSLNGKCFKHGRLFVTVRQTLRERSL